MTETETYDIIDVDIEEEPNQTCTIMSSDYLVVKYVYDDDLEDDLDGDDEHYRSEMGLE